jgi:AraC family transcriptional regulator of adaptative response / DNA-3-methyladenine glycosylase II
MQNLSTADPNPGRNLRTFSPSRVSELEDARRSVCVDDAELDPAICWSAFYSRDARFDGRFFIGVITTKIYCRPICPVPFAKKSNVVWLASAAEAEADGFRPCRRCRPQAAPGTPAWLGSSAVVSRALRLISEGSLDNCGVDALADRLGIGSRQLRRLFVQHLGAPPLKIAITRRIRFAQTLIEETDLPITSIAMSSGFSSIRQFNHAIHSTVGKSPTEIRQLRGDLEPRRNGLVVRLPYLSPFCWHEILHFLKTKSIPGVEVVEENCYRRTIEIGGLAGTIAVWQDADHPQLVVQIDLPRYDHLIDIVERVRRIFDLGADPVQIGNDLQHDPQLRPHLDSLPGLRVPGTWDGFELSVAAILGQRLSTKDSKRRSSMKRLVEMFGRPIKTSIRGLTHLFPRPVDLLDTDLSRIGIPDNRASTVRELARSIHQEKLTFHASKSLEETITQLVVIAGIDEVTAHYIAMRVFAEPDAFPLADPQLRGILSNRDNPPAEAKSLQRMESWRPWRAYAAMHFCTVRVHTKDRPAGNTINQKVRLKKSKGV